MKKFWLALTNCVWSGKLKIANQLQIGEGMMAKYVTKQRKILQEYLSQHLDEELSAKKLAEDLADKNVSLSAIYRNLSEMEKEKIVVQCHKEGSREFYFRYIGDEDCQICLHLYCSVCNQTEHIPMEESDFIKNRMNEKFNFQLNLPNTVFYGVCHQCRVL